MHEERPIDEHHREQSQAFVSKLKKGRAYYNDSEYKAEKREFRETNFRDNWE